MKTSQASGASLGDLRFEYFDQSHHNIFDLNEMKSNLIEAKQFDEKGLLTDSTQFLSGKSEYHQKPLRKAEFLLTLACFPLGMNQRKCLKLRMIPSMYICLDKLKKPHTSSKFKTQK